MTATPSPPEAPDPCPVPVALFLFNRPLMTARVFAAIRRARPRTLILVADGPRRARPRDLFLTAEARRAVATIDWDCTVTRHYSDSNLGCGRRMSSGIDAVFRQVDRAILLEDDCLPAPDFFRFCAELLDHYAEDPRVGMICGSNLLDETVIGAGAGYGFTRYTHIWGWATWRRAWAHYDFGFSGLDAAAADGRIEAAFGDPAIAAHWLRAYRAVRDGEVDTWDYQVQFASVMNRWANIVPRRNLVTNLGFGAEATHTTNASALGERPLHALDWPLRHPAVIAADPDIDMATERSIYQLRP